MKIVMLHHHGICPFCGELSCIYADYYRDDDGVKMQNGWECGSCGANFPDFMSIEMKCPKEAEE